MFNFRTSRTHGGSIFAYLGGLDGDNWYFVKCVDGVHSTCVKPTGV